jgi:hypothetical protein
MSVRLSSDRAARLVLAVGVALAIPVASVAVAARVATTAVGPSAAAARADSCTAAEKAQRVAALDKYVATIMRARRVYFQSHRSARLRRAFVGRQQAKLRALRRAAACTALPAGSRIVATVRIPTDGPAVVAGDAVWVVDREGEAANADGTPTGSIFRVDMRTNTVTDRIGGVAGGAADEGFGAVWVAAFNFNAVYRIDTATHRVARLASGPSSAEGPNDVALTATGVWVANHHGGTVAELDPVTGNVVRSLPIVAPGPGGPQRLLADGNDLWLSVASDSTVLRIDPARGSVVQRATVPGGTCGGLAADASQIWIAAGYCNSGRLSAIQRQTGRVTDKDVGGIPTDVAVAFGSLWVATDAPQRLLRVDPATRRVVGSLDLPATPWNIAVGPGALWVRVEGLLLRVVPQD